MPGKYAQDYFHSLPEKEKWLVSFGIPEQQESMNKYLEAIAKDFEDNSSYSACSGDPEDAVFVIEYE
jgi:hypothetical protein